MKTQENNNFKKTRSQENNKSFSTVHSNVDLLKWYPQEDS